MADGLEPENEYVIYQQGQAIHSEGAAVVLSARSPYFKRQGDYFCSHRYTPSAKGDKYPAALRKENVLLFSHPLFTQCCENAPLWCKKLISNAIDMLLDHRIVRHNGPSTMTISVLDQPDEKRTNLHILSYVPVRKSATIDIIEERTVLHNVTVNIRIPRNFTRARLVPENIPLEIIDGSITIPQINGYAIVELS